VREGTGRREVPEFTSLGPAAQVQALLLAGGHTRLASRAIICAQLFIRSKDAHVLLGVLSAAPNDGDSSFCLPRSNES
jgi:hypothetical protein